MVMLEKERNNEKQMRIKLEEEYAQNALNYEEEIQLRLKFEQKLNVMHCDLRDMKTTNLRLEKDLEKELALRIHFEKLYNGNVDAVIEKDRDLNARSLSIMNLKEKINSL